MTSALAFSYSGASSACSPRACHIDQGALPITLSERLSRLEILSDERTAGDLAVIRLQLTRAEGKLLKGDQDVRRELRIVEQRIRRAERRVSR